MERTNETVAIDGMTCGHCVMAVRQALSALESVDVERVDIGLASISFDPAQVDHDTIASAIEEAGYSLCDR
jgi:copper chaperone CopZ